MKTIRWGIIGPGTVAGRFAKGLLDSKGARIAAVASRSHERASRFAGEFGAPRIYDDYRALAADGEVDAVYIGTPHSCHREHAILCLEAGRHVLCEKPFAINASEAVDMTSVARSRGLALMEGMWMRFIPSIMEARRIVAEDGIGRIRRIDADFGFRADFDPAGRLFDPALGGGALLDVGVYGVSLAHMLLGEPEIIEGTVRKGETGVDEESATVLRYRDGSKAVLTISIVRDTSCEALISGTGGSIAIPGPWWRSDRIVMERRGRGRETIELPRTGYGFAHEAEHFMDLLRSGRTESEVMPLTGSIAVMETMDRIRSHWGLKYPME